MYFLQQQLVKEQIYRTNLFIFCSSLFHMLLFQKYLFREHLDKGEKLFEVFHRHSIEMWKRFLSWILVGIIVPIATLLYAHNLGFNYSWWWGIGWILLSLSWIIYHFFDWYYDVILITNYSILHIQWNGFFDKQSSRIEYEDMKEVSITTEGILQTIFHYGQIEITMMSGGKTSFYNIPNPQEAEQILRRYKMNFYKFQRLTDGDEVEKILSEMVNQHVWKYGSEHGFLPRR